MKEIELRKNEKILELLTKYKKIFGYKPEAFNFPFYIGHATEDEIISELERCIKHKERCDDLFGFTEEEKYEILNGKLEDNF